MFAHKGKYSETRLDTRPAATPQGVDLPLVNGANSAGTHTKDMDADSSVLCDSQISSNSIINASEKTVLLEEHEDSGTNKCVDSSVSFEVANIGQNFTLNVNPSVGNVATIQNVVPSGNPTPTLWLPTIITSNSNSETTSDDGVLETQVEAASGSVSQIILSGNGTHTNSVLATNSQSNNKYSPKVQILTIPKQGPLSQGPPMSCIKSMVHATYVTPNDVKTKSGASLSNSVLNNQLTSKNMMSNVSFVSSTSHQQPQPMSSVTSSGLHMVNTPSSASSKGSGVPQHQSHILSRVVPGPKVSAQAVSRASKNTNSMQYQKVPGRSTFSNMHQPPSVQSSMSVKIIQQQSVPVNSKSALKSVPPNRSGILTNKQRASSIYQSSNQKQSSYSKSSVSGVSVTKPAGRNIPQRLVVQQTPNRLMMSSGVGSQTPGYSRGVAHYYQHSNTDASDGSARYNSHFSYMNTDSNTASVSSNQSLTAQILQSLSQSKVVPSRSFAPPNNMSPVPYNPWEDGTPEPDPNSQCKQIQGDPNTLRGQDDTLGIEERPNLPDDSLSYHYYSLQLVMLDHTYAVIPQSIATSSSNNSSTPIVTNTPISAGVSHLVSSPPVCSPMKASPSPTKCSSPLAVAEAPVSAPVESNYSYRNIMSRVAEDGDDDAGSVLSSIDDDDRRQGDRNGSDTETAPEGEGDEEGKTRCVCDFSHDDGYMICCDRCGEWQHVDCMGIDRQNIPDDYMCDCCQPRLIDKKRARSIQMRKKEELTGLYSSASDSSSGTCGPQKKAPGARGMAAQKKLLTVTTYSNTVGGVSRTVPMLPPQQASPYTPPYANNANIPSIVNNKRGPKRPRRTDNGRKGPKRKLNEKKIRRKSEGVKCRSKYSTTCPQTNQWNESYELAMTNHYSPELRAKIARYSSNKVGSNHAVSSSVVTAHFCTTVPHAGSKILIATKDMKEGCPIIELRGKYMLSTQHKLQPQPGGRGGSQRPGPYLFFYKFPKDLTQVCIDTRTYGNEARFVRRSCKPNAELQHCVIKGALHVYLVTISPIQSNTEITIRHETSGSYQPCACGNPKHCKQSPGATPNTDVHKNNGALSDHVGRERRGRARHTSSSGSNISLALSSPQSNKEETAPKLDKRRKSEPEIVTHNNEVKEDNDTMTPAIKVEPNLESDLEAIKGIKNITEEDFKIDNFPAPMENILSIKEEKIEEPKQSIVPLEEECKEEKSLPSEVKLEASEKCEVETPKLLSQPLLSPNNQASSSDIGTQKPKDCKVNSKSVVSRRASTHSVRTTRASLSASASNAAESADEKSDSQTDCKVTPKEKKKMTREERKMEAIVKAIERMERAEQKKLENKDKQIKRRESDPQQSSSVTSSSESKDPIHSEQSEDAMQKSNVKGRPRRRGRSRTTSQNQLKNANRLNYVDSDNIGTSEDEHHPIMSPRRKSSGCGDNYLDMPPVTVSSTQSPYQSLSHTDTALKQSFDRMKYGLSSVCLLVEAAVAPLETTFKSPKTKKAIMNEWLNKSPDANVSYELGSPDYSCTDNNNSGDHYSGKPTFLSAKSTDNLVKTTTTMIGNLSGGIMSADSTPEKHTFSDPSDNESCNSVKPTPEPCSPPIEMPSPTFPQKKMVARDLSRDTLEKTRTPKKMRRGLRSFDPSPFKRSLRSGGGGRDIEHGPAEDGVEEKRVELELEQSNPIAACLPPPPQHSAKKRWLRQAISEESDSPTAESPPNEMLTPLKKRRLARESLTSDPVPAIQNEEVQCPVLQQSPAKDPNVETYVTNNLSTDNCILAPTEETEGSTDGDVSMLDPSSTNEAAHDDSGGSLKQVDECSSVGIENISSGLEACKEDAVDSVVLSEFVAGNNSNEQCDASDSNTSNNDKTPVTGTTSNVHSTETSCNSSPILDEMDDIQKKIHSFHTENIQILKIRNKKQPKEKRKKVNLNFDLSVLDDQTVEVKLKIEKDSIPETELDRSETQNLSSADISLAHPSDNIVSGQDESAQLVKAEVEQKVICSDSVSENKAGECNVSINNNFPSTILFSDSFSSKSSTLANTCLSENSSTSVPDMSVIKDVIDRTVNLETSVFKDATLTGVDEYKNVEEILSRVNQMDSRNSVILSGLMKDTGISIVEDEPPQKVSQPPRVNDPRLNPPQSDKPKPIRRKLSISEYRRRHSMIHPSESSSSSSPPPAADPSPQTVLSEDEEDNMAQLEKKLEASLNKFNILSNMNMGVFNPQPTVHEKQREKLGERLRREFGLSIQDEDVAFATAVIERRISGGPSRQEEGISVGFPVPPPPPPDSVSHARLDG